MPRSTKKSEGRRTTVKVMHPEPPMKSPSEMTIGELKPYAAEYISRKRGKRATTPPILKPCKECGTLLSARQRRYPCPKCGTYNREVR